MAKIKLFLFTVKGFKVYVTLKSIFPPCMGKTALRSASILLSWRESCAWSCDSDSFGLNPNRKLSRWNPYLKLSRLEILVRIYSNWIGLNFSRFTLRKIEYFFLDCLGITRIYSDWFVTVLHQTRYKKFFELVRNNSEWFWIAR